MQTLEEIAKLADVSRSTVSRVINNDPHVSEETRSRVLQIIQDVGFQPNRAASSLAGGRMRIIGLVIPTGVTRLFTDPYFLYLIQGITDTCNVEDYGLMLWLADPEYERRMINQIVHSNLVDGVIVSSMLTSDPLIVALARSGVPYVLVGRHPAESSASYVDADNVNGAYQAVSFLIQHGFRRVATITGPQDTIVGVDRLAGYRAALEENDLDFEENLVVEGDFTEESGYRATIKLLDVSPNGIFAASDAMATGSLRCLRDSGLRVPEDVAVIGFDGLPSSASTHPPLTTVKQPITRMGTVAAHTLIEQIEKKEPHPRHIVLPVELIVRQST